MKENEQPKYNILRKLNGLGPIINSEWEFMVNQSKTLNVNGAIQTQENILDLLCRLQSSRDKVIEEENRVDAWIDKFNNVNSEKRNLQEKYNRLYSKVEHIARNLASLAKKFPTMQDKLVLSNIQRCLDDLNNAISEREGLSNEEIEEVIQERKGEEDEQREDLRQGS